MKKQLQRVLYYFSFVIALFTFSISCFALCEQASDLKKKTEELVSLSQAIASGKKLSTEELKGYILLAHERNDALLKELKTDPSSVSSYLLPKMITDRLPNELQPYLEKDVQEVQGTLEISGPIASDDKKEIINYVLKKNDGTSYLLNFSSKIPANVKTGQTIKIQKGIEIPIASNKPILYISTEDIVIVEDITMLPIIGERKVIAMLVNFSDQPNNRPWTIDQVKSNLFTGVNGIYNEFSYGTTFLSGDVVGWFTIPMASNVSCNQIFDVLPGLAEDAARRAGVDFSKYQHRIYMFPRNPNCGWGGWGVYGGAVTRAWINGMNTIPLLAHEIGHNFTLWHSHFLKCPNSPNTGNCTQIEYGDLADNMGDGSGGRTTSHWNAYQKNRLGWLSATVAPRILTVTTSGTYKIDPYENKLNIKALRVLKRINSNGSRDYYYVEIRRGIGYDRHMGTCTGCDFTKGVLIHQGNESNGNTCNLLDMTPSDNNSWYVALLPGRTFRDPYAANGGVRFTVNSVDDTGANVNVTFGGLAPVCKEQAPILEISPNKTLWISAKEEASYNVTVLNSSLGNCQPAQINLVARGENNIKATLSTRTLKLAPGKSEVIKLVVSSKAGNIGSIYTVEVIGNNIALPKHTSQVKACFGMLNS